MGRQSPPPHRHRAASQPPLRGTVGDGQRRCGMTVTTNGTQATRSRGITYQELLDTDTHPVPAVLRLRSDDDFGAQDVPVERYISRDFHELEKERLWSRVWQ